MERHEHFFDAKEALKRDKVYAAPPKAPAALDRRQEWLIEKGWKTT